MECPNAFNEYQQIAHTTSLNTKIGDNEVLYPVLGLADEAGEVMGKFKKLYRDKNGVIDEEFKKTISKEIGDCMWYIAEICTKLNIRLADVANENISKLLDRKNRDKIHGSGDER
jgi:NTP pyrophosphatase (non-canonical NTP hydrolase)